MPDDTPASGPGPNFTSFGGGAGAAGGIIGTNHLQSAIDKLSQAVDRFEKSTDLLSQTAKRGGGGIGGQAGNNWNSGLGQNWNAGTFQTFSQGIQAVANSTPVGPTSPYLPGAGQQAQAGWQRGQTSPYPNMGGTHGSVCTSTGSFGNAQMGGAWHGPPGGPGGPGGPGPGGPGGGGIPPYRPPGGGGGGGPTFGQLGVTVAAGAGLMAAFGKQALPGQFALNTYQQQAQLTAPTGTNVGAYQQQLAGATYGTQGSLRGGQRQVMWGQSPQDIAGAYATITNITGFGAPQINDQRPGSLAGAMIQGTAQASFLNPAMSGTQAAQLMGQMYNPQSSLQQHMLGYGVTPLTMGRPGANGMAAWTASQFSRWGWNARNKPTPQQMAAEMGPNGVAYQNMLAEGMSPSQIQQMQPQMLAYGRLFEGNGKGAPMMSTQQAQQVMSGLSSRNPSTYNQTLGTLKRYGINQTDLGQLKAMAGSQAAQQGDQSAGFTAGVTAFSRSVQDFRHAVQALMNALGLQGAEGFGQGFGGSMKAFGGLGGGLLGGLAGGMLSRGLMGRLLGGAGGAGGGGLGSSLGLAGGATESGAVSSALAGGPATAAGALGAAGAGAAGVGVAALGMNAVNRKLLGQKAFQRNTDPSNVMNWINPIHATQMGMHWAHNAWSALTGLFGGGAAPPGSAGMTMSSVEASLGGKFNQSKNSNMTTVPGPAKGAVKAAESQEGVPYAWGEEKPGKGFDCSGLIQWAYKLSGVYLPRTAFEQYNFLKKDQINPKAVQEGDLVWKDGTGQNMHEAMMINAHQIIEAPGPGQSIRTRPYNPGEWRFAAHPVKINKGTSNKPLGNSGKNSAVKTGGGAPPSKPNPGSRPAGGGVTGTDVVNYAKHFLGQPYQFGGGEGGLIPGRPGPFTDCSGLTYVVYNHLGIGQGMVANATSQQHWVKHTATPQVGGLVFFLGSDSPGPGQAGHVGIITGPNQMINDPHTGSVVSFASLGGNIGFGVSPSPNWKGGGGVSPGGPGGGGTGSQQLIAPTPTTLAGGTPGGGFDLGSGDTTTEGSTSEVSAVQGALSGGTAGTGNGITSPNALTTNPGNPGLSTPGSSGPGGNVPAGSGGTGLVAVGQFLMKAGYSKAAAAGAAGVVGGEAGPAGNPESVGSGGAGLIGWTPPSAMKGFGGTCHAAGIGNLSTAQDMANQEQAMVKWMRANGWPPPQNRFPNTPAGAIQAAFSASAAYERPAVPGSDVHASLITGVFSKLARGGHIGAGGLALVGERGPELVSFGRSADVMDSGNSAKLMASAMGPHRSGFTSGLVTSPLHPAFQAGAGNSSGSVVNLNFGDIHVHAPATGSGSGVPTGNSARMMATQFVEELRKMNLHNAIASGANS